MDKRVEDDTSIVTWKSAQYISENYYMRLIELKCKAEEARSVLTNDCKTELVMTGFISDWEHFFDLRSKGITGKPHPDIKILADTLYLEFINKGYLK
jgi:thymidylate synthase (FAD)